MKSKKPTIKCRQEFASADENETVIVQPKPNQVVEIDTQPSAAQQWLYEQKQENLRRHISCGMPTTW